SMDASWIEAWFVRIDLPLPAWVMRRLELHKAVVAAVTGPAASDSLWAAFVGAYLAFRDASLDPDPPAGSLREAWEASQQALAEAVEEHQERAWFEALAWLRQRPHDPAVTPLLPSVWEAVNRIAALRDVAGVVTTDDPAGALDVVIRARENTIV